MDMSNGNYNNLQGMQDECKKYLNYHVIITLKDGRMLDGIIQGVGNDYIDVLAGEDVMEDEDNNQYDQQRQPYGHNNYYHKYPRRRFRRFRPMRFPFGGLGALALLTYPYGVPYPYSIY